MATVTDDRVILDPEEAEARLPDGERVHVVSNPDYGLMIGADWDRADVLDLFRRSAPELAGPIAASSGHGIAVRDGDRRLFVATREAF